MNIRRLALALLVLLGPLDATACGRPLMVPEDVALADPTPSDTTLHCTRIATAESALTPCPDGFEWRDDGAGCVRRDLCCQPSCDDESTCTWCWGQFVCLEPGTLC